MARTAVDDAMLPESALGRRHLRCDRMVAISLALLVACARRELGRFVSRETRGVDADRVSLALLVAGCASLQVRRRSGLTGRHRAVGGAPTASSVLRAAICSRRLLRFFASHDPARSRCVAAGAGVDGARQERVGMWPRGGKDRRRRVKGGHAIVSAGVNIVIAD